MGNWDTWGDMKNRVREGLADFTDSFYTVIEIEAALNEGLMEFYKIVRSHNVGFFFNTTPEAITLTTSSQYYPLTNDFGAVDRIEPTSSTNKYKRFIYKNRHDEEFKYLSSLGSDVVFGDTDTYYYDIVGDKTLQVVPVVASSMSVDVYTVREPANLPSDGNGDASTALFVKNLFRPIVCQYAVRKLKGKEETAEYASQQQLLDFLLETTSKYIENRAQTNAGFVQEF